ncbi:MAG: hypothetical protein ACYTFA_04050 [Planctomycetota bacterium]|jgi:hypothetical protein
MNHRSVIRRWAIASKAALALTALQLAPGCAFMNRDNTPVTNYVEEKLTPESARVSDALVPLVWPVAAATLTADTLVVHPASVVDDAVKDTRDCLWDNFEWDTEYATECFKLPWRAVFTPIVFGFDWLGRSIFDIPRYDHKAKASEEAEQSFAEAFRNLEAGLPAEASTQLDQTAYREFAGLSPKQQRKYYLLRLKAAYASGDYSWFDAVNWRYHQNLKCTYVQEALLPVLEEMAAGDDAIARLKALKFAQDWFGRETREAFTLRHLGDPDPVIRFHALDHLRDRSLSHRTRPSEKLRAVIRRLAADDPNPVVRARAAEIAGLDTGEE